MNEQMKDQIIAGAIELGFAIITIIVLRKVMQPDFVVALKMRSAQSVKRFAQGQADQWQRLADNAATVYQKARM